MANRAELEIPSDLCNHIGLLWWAGLWLFLAGIGLIATCLVVILVPSAILSQEAPSTGLPEPWRMALSAVGMALGAAFLAAVSNPVRHWPVALAGLISSAGLVVAWHAAATRGAISWPLAGILETFHFLGGVASLSVLRSAYARRQGRRRTQCPDVLKRALRTRTHCGRTLVEMSRQAPLMLVFLRHTGCMFCREALSDLAAALPSIRRLGVSVVVVTMCGPGEMVSLLRRYGVEHLPRVSDPHRALYRAFGLLRAGPVSFLSPRLWLRALQAAVLGRHGFGRITGDPLQMGGIFCLFHGEVVRSCRHLSVADRTDYLALIRETGRAAPS